MGDFAKRRSYDMNKPMGDRIGEAKPGMKAGLVMSQALTDQSPMPFGAHKGRPMEKVPANYLLWLRDQGCRNPLVKAYIEENLAALCKECPDYIN